MVAGECGPSWSEYTHTHDIKMRIGDMVGRSTQANEQKIHMTNMGREGEREREKEH